MPRPPRADEAGGLYHALNRANMRATIFTKDGDFAAFEKILHEGLELHEIELFSYQLMPNHYHLVLRPWVDGETSRFMGWVGGTHTMRYHAHHHTSGQGHVYQQRYQSFPIQDEEHFLVVCRYVERNALRAGLGRKGVREEKGSEEKGSVGRKAEEKGSGLFFDAISASMAQEKRKKTRKEQEKGHPLTGSGPSAKFIDSLPIVVPFEGISCPGKLVMT